MKHKDFSEGSRCVRDFRLPLPKKDGSLQVKAAVCFAPYVWIFSCGPVVPRRFDSISSACRGVIYARSLPQGRGGPFWGWGGRRVGQPAAAPAIRNGHSRRDRMWPLATRKAAPAIVGKDNTSAINKYLKR